MSIEDLLDNLSAGELQKANDVFNDLLSDKLNDALDQERIAVASSIFNDEQQAEEDIKEFEFDDEDLDVDDEEDDVEE